LTQEVNDKNVQTGYGRLPTGAMVNYHTLPVGSRCDTSRSIVLLFPYTRTSTRQLSSSPGKAPQITVAPLQHSTLNRQQEAVRCTLQQQLGRCRLQQLLLYMCLLVMLLCCSVLVVVVLPGC
jgi:hypothetical protein